MYAVVNFCVTHACYDQLNVHHRNVCSDYYWCT